MKAWLLPKLGSIENLVLADVPDPTPAAGEVVLRMKFAALNPADRYLAEGMYPARPTLPHIMGRDGLGIVEAVGEGVSNFKIGDEAVLVRSEVGVNRPGTLADKVAVPVESLVRRPEGWTEEESAGATLVYLTAWQALTQWGDLPPSVVLITGASGGVGVASIHLAKAMGHTVVALSRGTSKVDALKEQGADHVLDPTDTQWRRTLKTLLNNKKVDLAIDNIGGELFKDVIDAMNMWGRVSVVGQLADETGGEVLRDKPEELQQTFDTLITHLRTRYSLSFVSTNKQHDGTVRKLKVDVAEGAAKSEGKLVVKARKSYVAPKS